MFSAESLYFYSQDTNIIQTLSTQMTVRNNMSGYTLAGIADKNDSDLSGIFVMKLVAGDVNIFNDANYSET